MTAEDDGDDGAVHVFVDAGEAVYGDGDAGFFEDFAADAFFEGFVEFEDAAGWFPFVVVAAADDEDAVLVVDDDSGDADGMLRRLGHGVRFPYRMVRGTVTCLVVYGSP